ncbi:MAG: hypothetical protein ACHQYP_11615 [Nitrospiria bacterium]
MEEPLQPLLPKNWLSAVPGPKASYHSGSQTQLGVMTPIRQNSTLSLLLVTLTTPVKLGKIQVKLWGYSISEKENNCRLAI